MAIKSHKLHWQESMNGVTIDCDLDVRFHPTKSSTVLLLIPGVDGSVDGYNNKYVTIAEQAHAKHNVAVVRMENPFVTSFHWESNIRRILEWIEQNKQDICSNDDYSLLVQAHSAGASVLASIAHEYPNIRKLLLINIAMRLNTEKVLAGIQKYDGDVAILMGDKDPSIHDLESIKFSANRKLAQKVIIENADHDFSGDSFKLFIEASNKYLLGDNK